MKKIYLGVLALAIGFNAYSQSYSDDFESYSVGDYIGVESATWTTWSGTTGGAEDAQIVDDQANSGSNSLYFEGGPGPQDAVLDFGGLHTEGLFNFEAYFYIPSGSSAYFNMQGAAAIGVTWALDVYMNTDASIDVSSGGVNILSSDIPNDEWFKVAFVINLTTNNWQFLLNDVSLGSWANAVNQISMFDFYPATANDLFYVDDVAYSLEDYVIPNLNAGVQAISIGAIGLAGQEKIPTITIANSGLEEITSFDLDVTYNGALTQFNETGLSLASLESMQLELSAPVTLIAGSNDLVATVSNVNGMGADDNPNDDSNIKNIDPAVPALGKVVIAEEGTGTWCGWCPRGAVAMDFMADNYDGYYYGIAVHNGDPMTNEIYDAGLGFTAFPGAKVDRVSVIDPSNIEMDFVQRVEMPASGTIETGAQWDGDNLMVSLTYSVIDDIPSTWKIACVLTEDGVTGTTGYAQSNYYSGGVTPMGGYEDLANPVPASIMVYDHVARTISPSVSGLSQAFPGGASIGETYTFNFSFPISSSWDADNMHIVGLLIQSNGNINNGGGSTVAVALDNGYVEGQEVLGIEELSNIVSNFELYPNPANNSANINIELKSEENVSLQILDLTGKVVKTVNYGQLNGVYILPIDLIEFNSGMYIVNMWIGNQSITQKLMVD